MITQGLQVGILKLHDFYNFKKFSSLDILIHLTFKEGKKFVHGTGFW